MTHLEITHLKMTHLEVIPLAGLGGTPAFIPYTISYNGFEYASKTNNTGGTITIPIPPPGQNSEDISISMNQFGLTSADDVNESSLQIKKEGNLIGARWNSKSSQFDSLPGNDSSPIVISTPGIYNFTLVMNSTAIGTQIKTELLIETL